MTIFYRYCQPAPDPLGRSVFSLEIDGPKHPFVPVVAERIETPDGAGPEQILEMIYLRNESQGTAFRPRRFEITSMFPGCLVHLQDHGWWLCEPVGFRPAPFEPVILDGKTLYCGELIENFPRRVRVQPTPAGRGMVGVDGEIFLSRRGVSTTLEGTFGETRIEVHPATPGNRWAVLAFRPGAGRSPRHRLPAVNLPAALALAARIASEALHRPLVPAPVIAALVYRGTPVSPSGGIPDRIVSPLYYDPVSDAIHAAADDHFAYRFRDGMQGSADDATHPAVRLIEAAARVGLHEQDRRRGHDFCKRRLAYLTGALWLAESSNPLDCGLLSEDMAMHPLPAEQW
jgi:hypothetical protein